MRIILSENLSTQIGLCPYTYTEKTKKQKTKKNKKKNKQTKLKQQCCDMIIKAT